MTTFKGEPDSKGEPRPYNFAVLAADKGKLWVYVFPAQTKDDVWPLGGDFRYLMSADGDKILAKRQLHVSVIDREAPKKEANKEEVVVAGVHTHVLADIPEDTDVFHVLSRKPPTPEIVVTKKFIFSIEVDGTVKFARENKDGALPPPAGDVTNKRPKSK